jgi:hypothetical protein
LRGCARQLDRATPSPSTAVAETAATEPPATNASHSRRNASTADSVSAAPAGAGGQFSNVRSARFAREPATARRRRTAPAAIRVEGSARAAHAAPNAPR